MNGASSRPIAAKNALMAAIVAGFRVSRAVVASGRGIAAAEARSAAATHSSSNPTRLRGSANRFAIDMIRRAQRAANATRAHRGRAAISASDGSTGGFS